MEIKDQNSFKRSRKISISVVLYVIASVIAIVGVALLVDNIFLFRNTVNQNVARKIPLATILNQLVPSKLLPGIFEPIAVYGGISSILFGIGMLNKKISKCLMLLTKTNASDESIEEGTLEQNTISMENVEITKEIENAEILKKFN